MVTKKDSHDIQITINCKDGITLKDISNDQSQWNGRICYLPGIGILKSKDRGMVEYIDTPKVIEFILTFSSGISSGVIANWLYNKLKNRSASLKIDLKEISIEKGEIKKIIDLIIEKNS